MRLRNGPLQRIQARLRAFYAYQYDLFVFHDQFTPGRWLSLGTSVPGPGRYCAPNRRLSRQIRRRPAPPAVVRAAVRVRSASADDADERGVGHVDRAGLQRLGGVPRRDVLVPAEVDAHVAGSPHQVARLGLGRRDYLAGAALSAGAARQVDTDLGE